VQQVIGKPHVWTLDELREAPNGGWFYGFYRDDETGRVRFGELYPNWAGYCSCWPYPHWSPRAWWYALRDSLTVRP
jgi:hypothetical protein